MSDSNVRYVGLDVHKRILEACILSADGEILRRDRLTLRKTTLEVFAQEVLRLTDKVVLEATTNTWAVVRILKPYVAQIVVSNPLATKAIATAKVKTDKVDALVLAQLLRCDYLPTVWQPDEPTQELRRLTGHRASLVGDRTRIKNRLHSVLAGRLIEPSVNNLFSADGRTWLREVELDAEGRLLIDSDLRLLEALEKEIETLDDILAKKAYQQDRVKLLMTLPGWNVAVAQAYLAAVGDIGRFNDPDQVPSYLGIVPKTRQSADKCYHGPITKAGNNQARWMLVQAAHHLRNHPGPLGVFFRRVAKRKNYNVAVVAGARKMAVIACLMLRSNEPYRYAIPRTTEAKLAKLRVKATGQRRKLGSKAGTVAKAKLGPGTRSRTINSLPQIYRVEGLPATKELSAGEGKTVARTETTDFVQSLAVAHVVPRKRKTQTTNA